MGWFIKPRKGFEKNKCKNQVISFTTMNKFAKLIATLLLVCPLIGIPTIKASNDIYKNVPFKMDRIAMPEIPSYSVQISDFGGIGDGKTINTQAFAKAIDHLVKKGGGKLIVPFGVWYTGPIELKSHIELHLEDGALILFSSNRSDYPLVASNFEGVSSQRCMSPITANNAEHIAITGNGIFNGNGQVWRPVKKGKLTSGQWSNLIKTGALNEKQDVWYPSEAIRDISNDKHYMEEAYRNNDKASWEKVHDFLRPTLVSLTNCKYVLLEDATFENSPGWNIHPLMCQDMIIKNINIRNPWYAQNGDGLDLESCKNVLLKDCSLDVGDDAICIKSGRDKEGRDRGMPTENVIVNNCRVYHGHGGFVIGSEMSGGARNIWVDKCQFIGTDCGLRFKSTRGRGGIVENIYINNVGMANIPGDAIVFDLYYAGANAGNNKVEAHPVDETTPIFRNIHINNIMCNGAARAGYFNGLPEMPIQNITIKNSTFTTNEGIVLNHVEGIDMKKVNINMKKGEKLIMKDGVKKVSFEEK